MAAFLPPGPAVDEGEMPIQNSVNVVSCRQMVKRLADSLRFSLTDATKLVTAASELARNTLIHGGGGSMHWWIVREDKRIGVKLAFVDQGAGIPDMSLAMSDGWTSKRGMGLGLPGARRLVNEFDIESAVTGTRVTIIRWIQRRDGE